MVTSHCTMGSVLSTLVGAGVTRSAEAASDLGMASTWVPVIAAAVGLWNWRSLCRPWSVWVHTRVSSAPARGDPAGIVSTGKVREVGAGPAEVAVVVASWPVATTMMMAMTTATATAAPAMPNTFLRDGRLGRRGRRHPGGSGAGGGAARGGIAVEVDDQPRPGSATAGQSGSTVAGNAGLTDGCGNARRGLDGRGGERGGRRTGRVEPQAVVPDVDRERRDVVGQSPFAQALHGGGSVEVARRELGRDRLLGGQHHGVDLGAVRPGLAAQLVVQAGLHPPGFRREPPPEIGRARPPAPRPPWRRSSASTSVPAFRVMVSILPWEQLRPLTSDVTLGLPRSARRDREGGKQPGS